ncbi:MAG: Gfo/Idh/MocA family oxidoreductase [Ruminococcaceae bacterium]|nr:Gfo/Idh/MocA family oxidoreductase [Oscillospiraceae bacterium]
MKTINIGVIGCGFMGKTHTFGYKTIPLYYDNLPFKINLKTICASHIENAKNACEMYGYENYTDNFMDIINDDEIDVVDICTPNAFHKDAVLEAMKKKKHIYCDKPLAINYNDAKEIADIEKNYESITQMTFQNRFFPATMLAKKMIDEGKLGNILTFGAKFLHSGSVDKDKTITWKNDEKIGGGGVILDLGSHVFDIIRFLIGDYKSIYCKTKVLYDKRPDKNGRMVDITNEDEAFVLCDMMCGAGGNMTISKIATGTNDELSFEIYGDKGALRFDLMDANYLYYFDNTQKEDVFGGERGFKRIECVQRFEKPAGTFPSSKSSIGWLRGHVHCLYNFLNAVYEGKKTTPSFCDGAYINYIMDLAYKSAKENKEVYCD